MKARILVVDDHEIVRSGIRRLIEEAGRGWEVCGEAANGAEAIERVESLHPDVVVLDIAMPLVNGLEAASRITKEGDRCRVLLFTMYESKWLSTEARQVGAHGLVMKSQAGRELILAIDSLLRGGTFFGQPEGEPSSPENSGARGGGLAFSVTRRFSFA